MKAIKCSRCGKYQDTGTTYPGETLKTRSCNKFLYHLNGKTVTKWYDLCEECSAFLEAWINEPKIKDASEGQ